MQEEKKKTSEEVHGCDMQAFGATEEVDEPLWWPLKAEEEVGGATDVQLSLGQREQKARCQTIEEYIKL